MAVDSVNLIQTSGEKTLSGQVRTDTYQVIFDAVPTGDVVGQVIAASAGGTSIPSIGDLYTGSSTLKCKSINNVRREGDSLRKYTVDVNYDNISNSSTITDNPLSRPATIEWGYRTVEKPVEKDLDDNETANSAGDPFINPPIVRVDSNLVCRITRNVATHDPADAFAKINTVNSAKITIAGVTVEAGQALLTDYSAVAAYEGDVDYVQQHFTIEFAKTFDVTVGDMGYYFIDASDGDKKKEFFDDEGKPSRVPRYLTSGGDDGGGTPRFLTFRIYDESNFGELGLPTSFPDF